MFRWVMDNIDIMLAFLTTLVVILSTIIINRHRYRRQKITAKDLWGSDAKAVQISDYFYTDE
jgi:hypothetical protein|tara:strand:- start:785 stop:970 length:186 start_codon:yes stop_codon:yes gene_type:complete